MSMNRTKIDWENKQECWKLDYTWNPGYGCKNNCYYCYARSIHNWRMDLLKKDKKMPVQYAKPFSEIQFFPKRLKDPLFLKKPTTIFVGDMGDIFWQERENVEKVLKVCMENPQHRFLFLTKIPKFYKQYYFSINCWLGITVEDGKQLGFNGALDFQLMDFPNKFLSIEPLLGSFEGKNLSFVSWVIVGKMTGKHGLNHYVSKSAIESVKHDNIYYKKNIQGDL